MQLKLEFLSAALLALLCGWLSPAFAQAPYYQGKTITIVRGGEPGGSGDAIS